jgi:two-component system LytT family sensor kinase
VNVRSKNQNERHETATIHEVFDGHGDSQNAASRRITLMIVTLFWVGQFGANTLFAQLTSPEVALETLWPRAVVCAAGAAITLGCIVFQERWRHSQLAVRAYWAIACTIVSAAALAEINYVIFAQFGGGLGTSPFWILFTLQMVPRLWVFGSVYAMALAISYSTDVRAREQEIAALAALAQDAQLRALRSQLNPHFLFNALNSIAALIHEERTQEAEATTEDLADFLRVTLSLDPQRLIQLHEEISLQRSYLEIQKVRFPTRLNVIIDIAPEVENALVPNLILQPLIENSIKHAVAKSSAPVTVTIQARTNGGKLEIKVKDNGAETTNSRAARGTGFGLVNVAARLSAHFGSDAALSFGACEDAGFSNSLVMPYATLNDAARPHR